ncbi:MAG: PD-(D/E)XK nuclease family protein, partial [Steroidobacteraceae bacterium]|nr:PD-(D/E)XK nuclease family protein [Steroidobacteraceae bacterium]MDW8260591.1 PD-(D/E)XK nuclease family protein [Gammaproteobacteria bacterium]
MRIAAELAAHLSEGSPLLVATAAQAAAVRAAFARHQLDAGIRAWPSPSVLTPLAWLQRAAADHAPPLLTSAHEWQLLRSIAAQDQSSVLPQQLDSLADSWQRSLTRLRDLAIAPERLERYGAPPAQQLAAVRGHLQQRCAALGAIAPCLAEWQPSSAPSSGYFAGFAELPPAWRSIGLLPAPRIAARAQVAVCCAADPISEVERALDWAAQRLRQDPRHRLLLIAPADAVYRCALVRGCDDFALPVVWDIERRFSDEPTVRERLMLLRLCAQELAVEELLQWLREPRDNQAVYGAQLAAARAIEQRFARVVSLEALQRPGVVQFPWLTALARWSRPPAAHLTVWIERLQALFAELTALGYCAPSPVFAQLLDEIAISASHATLGIGALLQRLEARAQRAVLPAAAESAGLTIRTELADPVVRYDGIWICGLTSERWPAHASPDPWIPVALQVASGALDADGSGRLRAARALADALLERTDELRLSWPAQLGDAPAEPSPLLARMLGRPLCAAECAPLMGHGTAAQRMQACAPPLERYADERYARPISGLLPEGAAAIDQFNECAFRGAARVRLAARATAGAATGITPRERGTLLHAALEEFWRRIGSASRLRELTTAELSQNATAAARAAVAPQLRGADRVHAFALQLECERIGVALQRVAQLELQRDDFVIETIETDAQLRLGRARLRLRPDRVDRDLRTGQWIVIDYKSGTTDLPDWLAVPPRHLQLLLYREL